jgi:endonuclease YncB( thermonuclease family)
MVWKPRYPPDRPKRRKRSFDAGLGLLVVLTIAVLGFGLDRVARYVTGESRVTSPSVRIIFPNSVQGDITVVDGDTVRADGATWRLVGFNAPEGGSEARCGKERELAAAARARLQRLVAGGRPNLQRVACACAPGTEGTDRCDYGRLCGRLTVDGRDVARTMIDEKLAEPYVCGATSCPPRRNWCR